MITRIEHPENEWFYDGYYIVLKELDHGKEVKLEGLRIYIHPELEEDDRKVTLQSVSEKYPEAKMIIWESFLTGKVYRYNNYGDNLWNCIGTLAGFA